MKISKTFLTVVYVSLFFTLLLCGFGYINSLVSYKYEVEGDKTKLDARQIEIIQDIQTTGWSFVISILLLTVSLYLRLAKPQFNDRLKYVK